MQVNHSVEFKNKETGAHTNHIEAAWGAAKRTIEASGRRKKFYAGYLAKYIFLKECRLKKIDPYEEFFKAAGKLYDPKKMKAENVVDGEDDVGVDADGEDVVGEDDDDDEIDDGYDHVHNNEEEDENNVDDDYIPKRFKN